MSRASNVLHAQLRSMLRVLAMLVLLSGGTAAAAPAVDEKQFLDLGFKELVATTEVQLKWVQGMPPGKIRAMQRNEKKYFIYPDAARNRIFVGGPKEHAAYLQLHPESAVDAQAAAKKSAAHRVKQDDVMRKASATDNSNPFLGASWYDLGW